MKIFKLLLVAAILAFAAVMFITSCDNRTMQLPEYEITSMIANPGIIYADEGVTYSEIKVAVKDDDGFGVTGETVTFRADLGNILYEVLTDSTGVATTTFWDTGEVGVANIDAFISDESKRVQVDIQETPPIESLTLDTPTSLKVAQTAELKAIAVNNLGSVPNGTIVVFSTDYGYFTNLEGADLGSLTQVTTTNGVAKVTMNAGTISGHATISAQIGDVLTENPMLVNPGSSNTIDLMAEPDSIQVGSGEDVMISANVQDSFGNSVLPGTGVDFTTSIGNITPFAITDSMGVARAIFSAGVQAGLAEIEAVSDSASASTVVTVSSDGVYSMVYAFPGQVDINIQGTGGTESYEIVVNLYDSNGNLIDVVEEVWFKLLNAPTGANINNQIFNSTDSLSVMSDNGQAVVSVNSGYEPGTVTMKAYTYNDLGHEIAATKSNIVIHSGPPNSIELVIPDFNSGTDIGSGLWQIEVSAIIADQWGNPVDYGTAVWFELVDPVFGNDPDWATIGAEGYVGNVNAEGDSTSGVCYTYLNYDGTHTNDELTIQVEVGGPTPYVDSDTITLPIQFPALDVVAVPTHVDWQNHTQPYTNNFDSLYTTLIVTVVDEQNNPIDNQEVYFQPDLGTPYQGYTGYTGVDPDTGEHGILKKRIYFNKNECPAPVPAPPGTTTAPIIVKILGPDVTNQVSVILNRYVD